eukprot:EG_transcript_995
MFRPSSSDSDAGLDPGGSLLFDRRGPLLRRSTPPTPGSPHSDRSSPVFRRSSPPQAAPVDTHSWTDRVLGRRQKILDDLSLRTTGTPSQPLSAASSSPIMAARQTLSQSLTAASSPAVSLFRPPSLSASMGAMPPLSPPRKLDAEFLRKPPALLKPLVGPLAAAPAAPAASAEVDARTDQLLARADEAELELESAARELEEMRTEFVDLRTTLDEDDDSEDELLEEMQELRNKRTNCSRPTSAAPAKVDAPTQARHDLIRGELLKMKLSLLKDSEADGSAGGADADSPPPPASSSAPPPRAAASGQRGAPLRATQPPPFPGPPPPPPAASHAASATASFAATASLAAALAQCGPRPGTSLLNDLMSDWRPATAPVRTAPADRSPPQQRDLLALLDQLRSLPPAEPHWPRHAADLYARLNCCLALRSWPDLAAAVAEGLAHTMEDQPLALFLLSHGDVLCMLTNTFPPEALCALLWDRLFRALNAQCDDLETDLADAPGDIEDVVEAKQRALLDEEFVALVLENLMDVGLRRRTQGLIAGLAGLMVQRARLTGATWRAKCDAVFGRQPLDPGLAGSPLDDRRRVWEWTAEDVADWLAYHGLAELGPAVLSHGLDGSRLLNLSTADVEELVHTAAAHATADNSLTTETTHRASPTMVTETDEAVGEGWFSPEGDAAGVRWFNRNTAPLRGVRNRSPAPEKDDFGRPCPLAAPAAPRHLPRPTAPLPAQLHALLLCPDLTHHACVAALQDELGRRGVRSVSCLSGGQATRGNTAAELRRLCADLEAGHTVLVWFVGPSHASKDHNRRGWALALSDGSGEPGEEGVGWGHFHPFVEAVKGQARDSGVQPGRDVVLVFDITGGASIELSRADADCKNGPTLFPPSPLTATSSVQALCTVFPRRSSTSAATAPFTPLFTAQLARQLHAEPLHRLLRLAMGEWQSGAGAAGKQLRLVKLLGAGDAVLGPPL